MLVLLLSGPMAVGKTAVAKELVEHHGFRIIRSGAYLAEKAKKAGTGTTRTDLQYLGDKLDEETDYRWLIDEVAAPTISQSPAQKRWLFDSVRKHRQVHHFRDAFRGQVFHAHLQAPESVLRGRYEGRLKLGDAYAGSTPYEIAIEHPNEIASRSLSEIADALVDLSVLPPSDAAKKILVHSEDGGADAAGRSC